MDEILKQIEVIEAMQLDTRTECFMQLQQVKKLKLLLQQEVKNCSIPDVVVPKGTLCDVCGSENTITVSHKGENCDWCNPL